MPEVSRTRLDGAIKSISVVSTGTGEQHKEHRYGSRLPQMWWVLTSQSWIELPISAFVLHHRDGLVLFDAGLDPAITSDPNYISSAIGRFLLPRIFRLHIEPGDALDQKLKNIGFNASDVRKVVVSHLHFDHVGGIAHVPQADLLVANDEWRQLSEPHPEREWILREHIELPGAKWRPFDFAPTNDAVLEPFGGCFDVMGDGSMMLLPTPGHTPGSLSMLVRTVGAPPLLLIGDLAYAGALLMTDQVPGTGDAAQLKATYAKVRTLKESLPDLVILPSHDPQTADALKDATQAIAGHLK